MAIEGRGWSALRAAALVLAGALLVSTLVLSAVTLSRVNSSKGSERNLPTPAPPVPPTTEPGVETSTTDAVFTSASSTSSRPSSSTSPSPAMSASSTTTTSTRAPPTHPPEQVPNDLHVYPPLRVDPRREPRKYQAYADYARSLHTTMNISRDPCNHFYEYVCDGYTVNSQPHSAFGRRTLQDLQEKDARLLAATLRNPTVSDA